MQIFQMKEKISPESTLACSRESTVDAVLIQAYLETDYHVLGRDPFTLKVGIACPSLAVLNTKYRITHSAFITACNPASQPSSDTENAKRQADLAQTLKQRGFVFLDGIGQHPSNDWPGEPSFLVLGIDMASAKKLGNQFKQNAIIWNSGDNVPRLILLR